ncbi:DEAD/DEAH box helicase family protein [Streptomyces lunalinharesii]|uniref:DEAD/DEAH box helicase family protein n=1 Tax=Streptomyces lunalinharesii TaxID=333384 RepID=UPI0031CDDFAE
MTDDHSCCELRLCVMPSSPAPAASAMSPAAAPRRVLRSDQQHAVDAAVQHLKSPRSRGHIVSACGTGKTLTALRTAEALNAQHLLVAVPCRAWI